MTRWVLLVVALLAAPQVKALECPVMAGASPQLAAVEAEARIEFIRQRLQADSYYMSAWKYSWVGVYGAMTVAQGIAIKTDSKSSQAKWIAGDATAFIGFVSSLIAKRRAIGDGPTLADMPNGATPGATCYTLKTAEEFLLRDAEDEAGGRVWYMHLANVGVNLVAGVILGAVTGQWGNAVINFVAGTAVGEVQIFTQPLGAVDALRDYRAGNLGPNKPVVPVPHLASATAPGYQLALAF